MLPPGPPSCTSWKLPGPSCELPGAALLRTWGAFGVKPHMVPAGEGEVPQTSIGARLQAVFRLGLAPATADADTLSCVNPASCTSQVGMLNPVALTRTYWAGALPGVKGGRVFEYSTVTVRLPLL